MSKSTDPIPVFVFRNLKSFAPIYHEGVIKWYQYSREDLLSYKWSRWRLTIKNSFGTRNSF